MSLELSFNPVWSMQDLNGLQLDDSFYLFTLQNTLPYLFSPIYKTQDESMPWDDPIQFLANGSLPTNMYWDTTQVYRIEIRQGNSQSDPLIYLIENYIPNGSSEPINPSEETVTVNQISNPQFATVNFPATNTPGMSITTAGSTYIAPGWQIVTAGSGTVTINQVTLQGLDQLDSNPSYYISITNSGFSSVILKQTFFGNAALWSGQAVAFYCLANATSNAIANVSVNNSSGQQTVLGSMNLTVGFTPFPLTASMYVSTATTPPSSSWTDLEIALVNQNTTLNITSIQLIGEVASPDSGPVVPFALPYEQVTLEQQKNNEFWFYNPRLQAKPISSYLCGWDFPLNPTQFGASTPTANIPAQALGVNTAYYAWDQTILFQTVTSGITTSRDANGGLKLTAAATTQMAVIQYLGNPITNNPPNQVSEMLNGYLSANVAGYANVATQMTITLLYTTNAAVPILPLSCITGLNSDGSVSGLTGGWTIIPRNSLGNATFTMASSASSTISDYGFSEWFLNNPAVANTATYFAIVVGTASVATANYVSFLSISCVPGWIPTRPAPQTADEVLRECQYYYETSYPINVAAPSNTAAAPVTRNQGWSLSFSNTPNPGNITSAVFNATSFDIFWNTIKRSQPLVYLYTPAGVANAVEFHCYSNGIQLNTGNIGVGTWAATASSKVVSCLSTTNTTYGSFTQGQTAVNGALTSYIIFHYISDARLGVV